MPAPDKRPAVGLMTPDQSAFVVGPPAMMPPPFVQQQQLHAATCNVVPGLLPSAAASLSDRDDAMSTHTASLIAHGIGSVNNLYAPRPATFPAHHPALQANFVAKVVAPAPHALPERSVYRELLFGDCDLRLQARKFWPLDTRTPQNAKIL